MPNEDVLKLSKHNMDIDEFLYDLHVKGKLNLNQIFKKRLFIQHVIVGQI